MKQVFGGAGPTRFQALAGSPNACPPTAIGSGVLPVNIIKPTDSERVHIATSIHQ
jgi:hypothetical protein